VVEEVVDRSEFEMVDFILHGRSKNSGHLQNRYCGS
jgi:hypothetical protein